jgi:hypothetical protein
MNGICTLANDRVLDQLIALLNSIDAVIGTDMPVCIYPFDDQLDQVRAAIATRPNVFIYDDQESIQRWDSFMQQIAPERLDQTLRLYGAHRRFCAFDSPFEKFIYMDADTLAMGSLEPVFEKLDEVDWVVYDYQFLDPTKIFNLSSPRLYEVFSKEQVDREIFCSGFFGAKRGLFGAAERDRLIAALVSGDRDILYEGAGEQPVLNYMVLKSGISSCNLGSWLPSAQSTGCSVTSPHFEERDHVLYDRGTRLTYLHYIGVKPQVMAQVCQGQNLKFPYRDLFLHYRFLHQPEQRPTLIDAPPSNWITRALRKLNLLAK